jgi:hypothetical protein
MLRKIDWESQIGRRFRFRDLYVFFTVAHQGSMARAAAQLDQRFLGSNHIRQPV